MTKRALLGALGNKGFWKETGCSDFVYSVISEGYKPVLDGVPTQ